MVGVESLWLVNDGARLSRRGVQGVEAGVERMLLLLLLTTQENP